VRSKHGGSEQRRGGDSLFIRNPAPKWRRKKEGGGGRSVNPKKELLGGTSKQEKKKKSPALPSTPVDTFEKPFLGRFYFLLLFFRVFRTKPGK
jgi:hypothetical protein